MIEYAARKAKTEPLVFATGPAVTEYYRRHFTQTPETTCYQQDFFGGQTNLDKFAGWWSVAGGKARFVPVRAPFTGNLNGLLVSDVVKGENTFTVTPSGWPTCGPACLGMRRWG